MYNTIKTLLEEFTQQSKAFTWTADPDKIIAGSGGAPRIRFDRLGVAAASDVGAANTKRKLGE
jgi:hypothetical protein